MVLSTLAKVLIGLAVLAGILFVVVMAVVFTRGPSVEYQGGELRLPRSVKDPKEGGRVKIVIPVGYTDAQMMELAKLIEAKATLDRYSPEFLRVFWFIAVIAHQYQQVTGKEAEIEGDYITEYKRFDSENSATHPEYYLRAMEALDGGMLAFPTVWTDGTPSTLAANVWVSLFNPDTSTAATAATTAATAAAASTIAAGVDSIDPTKDVTAAETPVEGDSTAIGRVFADSGDSIADATGDLADLPDELDTTHYDHYAIDYSTGEGKETAVDTTSVDTATDSAADEDTTTASGFQSAGEGGCPCSRFAAKGRSIPSSRMMLSGPRTISGFTHYYADLPRMKRSLYIGDPTAQLVKHRSSEPFSLAPNYYRPNQDRALVMETAL